MQDLVRWLLLLLLPARSCPGIPFPELSRFGSSSSCESVSYGLIPGRLIWLRKQDHNFVQLANKNIPLPLPLPLLLAMLLPAPSSALGLLLIRPAIA